MLNSVVLGRGRIDDRRVHHRGLGLRGISAVGIIRDSRDGSLTVRHVLLLLHGLLLLVVLVGHLLLVHLVLVNGHAHSGLAWLLLRHLGIDNGGNLTTAAMVVVVAVIAMVPLSDTTKHGHASATTGGREGKDEEEEEEEG